MMRKMNLWAVAIATCFVTACSDDGTGDQQPVVDLAPTALSSPADSVSGDVVLVKIALPLGIAPASVTSTLNGAAANVSFSNDASSGSTIAVVSGLMDGQNTINVSAVDRANRAHTGSLLVVNSSKATGVITAPLRPLICNTQAYGLGAPTDSDCNAPTQYTYLYLPVSGGALKTYDPASPAVDVAQTTTDKGVTVPFVIRNERGVINRSVYDIALLFDPTKPWTATSPQASWNHKVLWRFQGGCAPTYKQGANSNQATDNVYNALGLGFAVVTSGASVFGNHCDSTISAENVLTVKSHVATSYGTIRYTMSDGGSGGSIQQHQIANAYPGLLNGIISTQYAFGDIWVIAKEWGDCHVLRSYFNNSPPTLWPDPRQQAAVMGKQDLSTCTTEDTSYFGPNSFEQNAFDPTLGCASPLPSPGLFDVVTNRNGVRCTLQDEMVAILGRRADGYANRPWDNVGVQYGLSALKSGRISGAQFVDLNSRVGGFDINNVTTTSRTASDSNALDPLYKSGQVVDAKQLSNVPMIAYQGYDNTFFHDSFQNYVVRQRLIEANGTAANQVIWTYPVQPNTFASVPQAGGAQLATEAFTIMDQWLAAIERDSSGVPLSAKVLANKPSGAIDLCVIAGAKVYDASTCSAQYPNFSNPRIVAGSPLSDAVMKCQLKQVDPSEYGTALSASELAQIRSIFPDGVCDYSRPGVGQQATVPWSKWLTIN